MVGLVVEDVEELSTHGGSLRVWLTHQVMANPTVAVDRILMEEAEAGLETSMAYTHFQHRAEAAKNALLRFFLWQRKRRNRF
jgi:hypothetical protein